MSHATWLPRRGIAGPVLGALLAVTAAGQLHASGSGSSDPDEEITYYKQVSRIIQENCVSCHRAGGIAPFALETYDQVTRAQRVIEHVVRERRMPPWFASPEHGRFANDRSLPAESRDALLKWIESGAPAGDPADAPPPLKFVDDWNIGHPDLVLELPDAVAIPAAGEIPYQYMSVPSGFTEDRWIAAVEVRPTAPSVAHHVLTTLRVPHPNDPNNLVAHGSGAFGGVDGYFALMVPGSAGLVYGEGRAKRVPAGAHIQFQLHYTADGHETHDRSQIGLVFAEGPPREEVVTASAFNTRFVIPPGAKDYEVSGDFRFFEDGQVLSFMPHTHVRGVRFRYELIRADGSREIVLDLPNYDFNWQLDYILAEPLQVRAGDALRATGWFDNSADNPANPDPTARVRFGEQTWEEMMIGYFDWIPASRVRAEAR
jgi:mono/diheme cytochrome c family protein